MFRCITFTLILFIVIVFTDGQNVNLQDREIAGNEIIRATNDITAGPNFTIKQGADVTFCAGKQIILKSGFKIENGAIFHAYVNANPQVTLRLAQSSYEKLAQRFRPYLKFSNEDGQSDPCRPCSWQWFWQSSQLEGQECVIVQRGQLSGNPARVLDFADIRKNQLANNFEGSLEYKLIPDSKDGQAWEDAKGGVGLYCHIESINARLVNIEYWLLFAHNQTTVAGDHWGDVVGVGLVYDKDQDKLLRANFLIHGRVIEAFDLQKATRSNAIQLSCGNTALQLHFNENARCQDGPWNIYDPSDPMVYLARNSDTSKYEHIVLFLEWGSHEPWPNGGGSYITSPKHDGDSYSFLPQSVQLIYWEGQAVAGHEPFVFYAAIIGDPPGLMYHRMWYGSPVPDQFRGDRNPYQQLDKLSWPPNY